MKVEILKTEIISFLESTISSFFQKKLKTMRDSSIFKQKIYILLVSETKIDDNFPLAQFCVEGYSNPYILGSLLLL